MWTPTMFEILVCVTSILSIVILIATSRSKKSSRGSQPLLYANSARGAIRSISKVELSGTARPRVRQGLDTKAVVKTTLRDIRPDAAKAAKAADSTPPIDRKAGPMTLTSTPVSAGPTEDTSAGATGTSDIASQAEVTAAPALAPIAMEPVATPVADAGVTEICVAPPQETPEVKVAETLLLQETIAAETHIPVDSEPSQIAEPAAANVDDSLSSGSLSAPALDGAAAGETVLPLVTESRAADVAANWVEDVLETESSGELLVEESATETPAPSLLAFYGLNQQAFDVTPDPAYLYRGRAHDEALTALTQGIENLRGFVALIAGPGMGKTTLLNKLMEDLRDSARVVFLFQTHCNSNELLRHMLFELGVEYDGTDNVAMHRALNQVLFNEMLQGRRFVLIVDEAQNLEDSVLETIRLLSNYETTHSKMIQIVLSGQPQLVDTLMRPSLVQLRQRIAVLANLDPLDVKETSEYIEHRLRAAGSGDRPIFTREAMELIALRSEGIPRSINNICFNAMLAGYMHRQLIIDSETVKRVASELDLELLVRRPQQEPEDVAPAAPSSELSQLANLLSTALSVKAQPEAAVATMEREEPKSSLSLMGRLNEKITSQSWSNKNEFQIQVSLERDYTPGLPIAEHYYCRSFYVSEEQAKSLEPGKSVRVKFEQD